MNNEMRDWFQKRTKQHINLVHRYMVRIALSDHKFANLIDRFGDHDNSKFKAPELEPYIYITWKYKCERDGIEFNGPEDIEEQMNQATHHHVKTNSHHPEYHCDKEVELINRKDHDKPSKELVDATNMPDLDIAEMCADWCAMSEEKDSKPHDWAKANINVRWKFTPEQEELIYKLLDMAWRR